MQKYTFSFLFTLALFLFIGVGSASATLIDFESEPLLSSNPTISGVSFFAGDPVLSNDVFVDDYFTPGTNQYLQSGFDDGFGSTPSTYDTFIGATANSGLFSSVTLDFATQDGDFSDTFEIKALSGTAVVGSITITPGDLLFHSYTIAAAAGFDTLHIFDTNVTSGQGAFFEIDNFDFTEWRDPGGGDQVPEPGTMMLFGLGLLGLAASCRKQNK